MISTSRRHLQHETTHRWIKKRWLLKLSNLIMQQVLQKLYFCQQFSYDFLLLFLTISHTKHPWKYTQLKRILKKPKPCNEQQNKMKTKKQQKTTTMKTKKNIFKNEKNHCAFLIPCDGKQHSYKHKKKANSLRERKSEDEMEKSSSFWTLLNSNAYTRARNKKYAILWHFANMMLYFYSCSLPFSITILIKIKMRWSSI